MILKLGLTKNVDILFSVIDAFLE